MYLHRHYSVPQTRMNTHLQHIPKCEAAIKTHELTCRSHHYQLCHSVHALIVQCHMMVASFQASFALAPGGQPRLPMRCWLVLEKCIVNIKLSLLHPHSQQTSQKKLPAQRVERMHLHRCYSVPQTRMNFTMMTRLLFVPKCEMDIETCALTRCHRHHRLGLSVPR